jgi:hypothetical protein
MINLTCWIIIVGLVYLLYLTWYNFVREILRHANKIIILRILDKIPTNIFELSKCSRSIGPYKLNLLCQHD